jgi:hypothetical protein
VPVELIPVPVPGVVVPFVEPVVPGVVGFVLPVPNVDGAIGLLVPEGIAPGIVVPGVAVPGVAVPGVAVPGVAVPFELFPFCISKPLLPRNPALPRILPFSGALGFVFPFSVPLP